MGSRTKRKILRHGDPTQYLTETKMKRWAEESVKAELEREGNTGFAAFIMHGGCVALVRRPEEIPEGAEVIAQGGKIREEPS